MSSKVSNDSDKNLVGRTGSPKLQHPGEMVSESLSKIRLNMPPGGEACFGPVPGKDWGDCVPKMPIETLGFDQLCELCSRQEKMINNLNAEITRLSREHGIQQNRAEQALKLIDGMQNEVARYRSNVELLEKILTQALAEPRGYR